MSESSYKVGPELNYFDGFEHGRRTAIEECAKIVERFIDIHPPAGCCHRHKTNIAANIRALSPTDDREPREREG